MALYDKDACPWPCVPGFDVHIDVGCVWGPEALPVMGVMCLVNGSFQPHVARHRGCNGQSLLQVEDIYDQQRAACKAQSL